MWNVELENDELGASRAAGDDSAAAPAPNAPASTETRGPQPGSTKKQVGQILIAKGVLTPEQIDTAIEEQKHRKDRPLLGELLVELGMVTGDQVIEALAEAYNVPYARLTPRLADPRAVQLI